MTDKQVLLASLEAQGVEFMKSFSDVGNKRKRSREDQGVPQLIHNAKPRVNKEHEGDSEEEEWTGFASDDAHDVDVTESSNSEGSRTPPACFVSQSSIVSIEARTPHIVSFCERVSTAPLLPAAKAQARAFMSSKVSKLGEIQTVSKGKAQDEAGLDQEASNIRNDALLHRLVHTQLLSGSLNRELDMTAAQRRRALAGRVRELAGASKLGKGECALRQDEKQRASKRVRDGMAAQQKKREAHSLDEAKNMGNYHPVLKKLFAASSSRGQPRKRDRGLKLGIGRFSGGLLKLTPEEIGSVRDTRSTRGRGRERGGQRSARR